VLSACFISSIALVYEPDRVIITSLGGKGLLCYIRNTRSTAQSSEALRTEPVSVVHAVYKDREKDTDTQTHTQTHTHSMSNVSHISISK